MKNNISQELYRYVVKVLGTEPHYSDSELNIYSWAPLDDVSFIICTDEDYPSITINDIQEPAYLEKMYQIIGYCKHFNRCDCIKLIFDFKK